MESINTSKFINLLCDKTPLTRQVATEIFKAFVDIIIENTTEGKPVLFKGFGKFAVKTRKARVGRNPKTGESVNVPEKRFLKFYPAKEYKNIK